MPNDLSDKDFQLLREIALKNPADLTDEELADLATRVGRNPQVLESLSEDLAMRSILRKHLTESDFATLGVSMENILVKRCQKLDPKRISLADPFIGIVRHYLRTHEESSVAIRDWFEMIFPVKLALLSHGVEKGAITLQPHQTFFFATPPEPGEYTLLSSDGHTLWHHTFVPNEFLSVNAVTPKTAPVGTFAKPPIGNLPAIKETALNGMLEITAHPLQNGIQWSFSLVT